MKSSIMSPSRFAIVLGDTAVSFDFGSVVLPKDASSTGNQTGLGGYRTPLWPIYVLQGNGEVYRMLTSLDTRL
jgi:Nuclear pore component